VGGKNALQKVLPSAASKSDGLEKYKSLSRRGKRGYGTAERRAIPGILVREESSGFLPPRKKARSSE